MSVKSSNQNCKMPEALKPNPKGGGEASSHPRSIATAAAASTASTAIQESTVSAPAVTTSSRLSSLLGPVPITRPGTTSNPSRSPSGPGPINRPSTPPNPSVAHVWSIENPPSAPRRARAARVWIPTSPPPPPPSPSVYFRVPRIRPRR